MLLLVTDDFVIFGIYSMYSEGFEKKEPFQIDRSVPCTCLQNRNLSEGNPAE